MLGQPLVEKRVVGCEQIADTTILEQHAADKRFDFGGQILAQLIGEGRKEVRVRLHFAQVVEIHPLEREVADQTRRAAIL